MRRSIASLMLGVMLASTLGATTPLGMLSPGGKVALRAAGGSSTTASDRVLVHPGDRVTSEKGIARAALSNGVEVALDEGSTATFAENGSVALELGGVAMSSPTAAVLAASARGLAITGRQGTDERAVLIVETFTPGQVDVTAVSGTYSVKTAEGLAVAQLAGGDAMRLIASEDGTWTARALQTGSPLLLPVAQAGTTGVDEETGGVQGEEGENDNKKAWWFFPAVIVGGATVLGGSYYVIDKQNDDDKKDDNEETFTGGGQGPSSPTIPEEGGEFSES